MREMIVRSAFVLGVPGLFFGIFAPFALRSGLRSLRLITPPREPSG